MTDILDLVEIPKIIAKFSLNSLLMKDMTWHMNITILTELPKANRLYSADIVFDDKPYLERLEVLNNKMESIRSDNSLFNEDTRLNGMDEITNDIEAVHKDMEEKKALCPSLRLVFTIEQLKWDVSKTVFTAIIDDNAAESLNKQKAYFPQYRLELTPQE